MKPIIAVNRRLTSAVFFLIAGIFILINLLVFDRQIDSLSLALESIWCCAWLTTSIFQIYYRSETVARIRKNPTAQPISNLEIVMARLHEQRTVTQPGQAILIGQFKPSVYYALHACLYLTTGILYAVALWNNGDNAPQNTPPELAWIRPIPNLCWLIAGINEVTRTLEIAIREHTTSEPTSSVEVSEVEELPPIEPNNTETNSASSRLQ